MDRRIVIDLDLDGVRTQGLRIDLSPIFHRFSRVIRATPSAPARGMPRGNQTSVGRESAFGRKTSFFKQLRHEFDA